MVYFVKFVSISTLSNGVVLVLYYICVIWSLIIYIYIEDEDMLTPWVTLWWVISLNTNNFINSTVK